MILNERVLHVVLALAEELHFGRAASRLHVSQPALSGTVRTLERDLGVRLFRRTSRRVELTEAGSVFAVEARQLIAQGARALALIRNSAPEFLGPLRLAYPPTIDPRWLCALISGARREGRFVSDLVWKGAEGAGLFAEVTGRTLHAAFFAGRVCHPDLECVTLFREEFALVAGARHRLSDAGAADLQTLVDEEVVWLRREVDPLLFDGFLAQCAARGYRPKIVQQVSTFHECLEFVRAGLGVTFLPWYLEADPPDPAAVFVPLRENCLYAECSLVFGRQANFRELDRFLKFAHQQAAPKRCPVRRPLPGIHHCA